MTSYRYCIWLFLINGLFYEIESLAGGFGQGSSSSKSSKSIKKIKGFPPNTTGTKINRSSDKEDRPKLDRFGLPIPTEEDIFPKLSEEETKTLVKSKGSYTPDEINAALKEYLQLNFSFVEQHNMKVNLVHESPPVLVIENFFTEGECLEYVNIASSSSNESISINSNEAMKVNSATFSSLAQSKRTSTTWFCHFSQVPTLLAKARNLVNLPGIDQFEEPQLVRYKWGEEFSWHYDEVPQPQLNNGGQRIATLLVYLNTLKKNDGGGTVFRDLSSSSKEDQQLTVRPVSGSALLFFPSNKDGIPDNRTLHKGEVVSTTSSTKTNENKMIGQIWIHQHKYAPVVPSGNSHEAAYTLVQGIESKWSGS